jgi:hypothetical protein
VAYGATALGIVGLSGVAFESKRCLALAESEQKTGGEWGGRIKMDGVLQSKQQFVRAQTNTTAWRQRCDNANGNSNATR